MVEGVVTGLAEGRVIGARNDGPRYHLVLTVRPTTVYKSPSGTAPDLVHLEFSRAVNTPASTFRDAIPDGTRVVVFGGLKDEDPGEPVANRFGFTDLTGLGEIDPPADPMPGLPAPPGCR